MTAITRNIPSFIRDPAISIIGNKCYTSLVENLDIADVDCLKYSLSKGLGIGIVLGGSIMKVPQLLLILTARSARGLSLPAYILETLSYLITTLYSYRNAFPFSTYGENFFLTAQNIIITLLMIYYRSLSGPSLTTRSKSNDSSVQILISTIITITTIYTLLIIPLPTLQFLQLCTLPLSVFSKLPQILQNQRAKSTGQLSTFAVGSQVAGCLARLFTTATEVGDRILFFGFAIALLLNVIVAFQMWAFWGVDIQDQSSSSRVREKAREQHGHWSASAGVHEKPMEIVVTENLPTPPLGLRQSTPQPTAAGGRRWSRKVD